MIDPDRVTEIFDELVINALRWSNKPERKITITVDRPEKKELPPRLNQPQGYLRVGFEDNGCGVPLDRKDRIFAPFYTTHPLGTGLGLFLVRRVVESHGGLIRERGRPGEGALFEIYLPIIPKMEREE